MDKNKDKLRQLKQRIEDIATSLDLSLEDFIVSVEDEGETVSFRVLVTPQALMTPDEEIVEEQFQDIIKGLE